MLTMIGAINEFERANLLERQKEGIAIAARAGRFRKKDIDFDKFRELDKKVRRKEMTVLEACKELGVTSNKTWYNLRKEVAERNA